MRDRSIRKIRERLGLTQQAFAAKFPVDERTVQRWEADTVLPSPMAMYRIREMERSLPPPDPAAGTAPATAATSASPQRKTTQSPRRFLTFD